jgi:chromosome segregation ATPase
VVTEAGSGSGSGSGSGLVPVRVSDSVSAPVPDAAPRADSTTGDVSSRTDTLTVERLGTGPIAPPASTRLPPMPEVPDGGLIAAARYAVDSARARVRRTAEIKKIHEEIQEQVSLLDGVLRSLGRHARDAKLTNRDFAEENRAIDAAEERSTQAERDREELTTRRADEIQKYEVIQKDLAERLAERETAAREAAERLERYETKRRTLRDRRKEIERRQKGLLRSAEEKDALAGKEPLGPTRDAHRAAAEDLRREAARLDADRDKVDRDLAAVDKPLRDATARSEAAKAELEAASRALDNAREGHGHRLAELEAEQARKAREHQEAETDIARRLVTLGTLVNLHRVDRPELSPIYQRIDELRAGIAGREREIDQLDAERAGYDRPTVIRGAAVIGGAVVLLITVVCVLVALL